MKWTIAGESREAQARPVQDGRFSVALGERVIDLAARVDHDGVLVIEMGDGRVVRAALTRGVGAAADERWVSVGGRTLRAQVMRPKARVGEHGGGASMQAPMPGRIVRVEVAASAKSSRWASTTRGARPEWANALTDGGSHGSTTAVC